MNGYDRRFLQNLTATAKAAQVARDDAEQLRDPESVAKLSGVIDQLREMYCEHQAWVKARIAKQLRSN